MERPQVLPHLLCSRTDAGQRPAQVALDVVVQRLQGRYIEQADARRRAALSFGACHSQFPVALVHAPQECGEGLARSGRSEDQGVIPALDGWPALCLRRRRVAENLAEPLSYWRG